MQELPPFFLRSVSLPLSLLELKRQRAAGADVISTWQEITPHERLQHARFAAALAADHRHLRQVDHGLAS